MASPRQVGVKAEILVYSTASAKHVHGRGPR